MTTAYQQLISVQQLFNIIDNENVVLLDASIPPVGTMRLPEQRWPMYKVCGKRKQALFFDIETHFSDTRNPLPHAFPTAKQFQYHARELGINIDSQIVVYDSYGIFSSARAWWMFKAMGHANIAVLNGGLPAWIAQGYPVKSLHPETEIPPVQGNFLARFNPDLLSNSEAVLNALTHSKSSVLDARAEARFSGDAAEPRSGVRSGHMPGAINLPYASLLKNGEMLPKAELVELFKQKTVSGNTLHFSCGSGVTACVLALAADIIGFENIKVYDGSWSEWGSNQSLPVVTGK